MYSLGVQQIMLGSVCKDEQSTVKSLKRIKGAGYDGIELNSFMIEPTPFIVRLLTRFAGMPVGGGTQIDWQQVIANSGLKVISLHTDLGSLEQRIDEVIALSEKLNTNKLVITGMYRFDYSDLTEVKNLSRRLNKVATKLHEADKELLYHNHNIEFLKVDNKHKALDIILEETDADLLKFEFDSYWAAEAGVDVISTMKKLGSRINLYHINDRGTRLKKKPITPILKSDSMELGYGNMPLKQILNLECIKEADGVILESHRNWIDGDPLKSAEMSAIFLREYLNDKE